MASGPTGEATVLFADLSGFTALTEAHGDLAAADLAERFYSLAASALSGGARVVKTIGDAVMISAPSAVAAMKTAMLLRHAILAEPTWPSVRAGLHAGPVVEREGDIFGATVNLAARVGAHARAGQILCTRAVVRALTATEFVFRPLGPVHLKNVHEALELFELVDGAPSALVEIDPVCRMRLDPLKALHHLPFRGRTFFFCSRACAEAFAADPAAWATIPS